MVFPAVKYSFVSMVKITMMWPRGFYQILLIEDDCESIGGEKEMTYPHITPELRTRITPIVIKEFSGLDHLPDELSALL